MESDTIQMKSLIILRIILRSVELDVIIVEQKEIVS